MTRITITISDEEKIALRALSEKEFRDPRMQAALIIRRGLESQGVLKPVNQITATPDKPKQTKPTVQRNGQVKFLERTS